MKKLEVLGKKLSKDEMKKINGGSQDCICFSGDYGSPPTGYVIANDAVQAFQKCPSGTTRVHCYPQQ